MTIAAWIAILTTFVVAVMSPGPDFLAVLRTSLSRGRSAGLGVGAGIAAGTAIWIVVTLLGIVAVISSHPTASLAVRVAGATFLTLYGMHILKQLIFSRDGAPSTPETDSIDPAPATSAASSGAGLDQPSTPIDEPSRSLWLRGFRLGFLTNTVGNPKALIFFSSLFATMVPPSINTGESILLGTIMVLYARAWFALVAVISSARRFVTVYQRLQRPLDFILGILFSVLGLSLFPWSMVLR